MEKQLYVSIADQLTDTVAENAKNVAATQFGEIEKLYRYAKEAGFIITSGKGRSGFMARFFAQRLSHVLLTPGKVYYINDTTTPRINKNSLVVIISGSGETGTQVKLANDVKKIIGAKLAVVTSNPNSSIARIADVIIVVPGRNTEESESILPLGTKFEISALVVLEAFNGYIIEKDGITPQKLAEMHRNKELE